MSSLSRAPQPVPSPDQSVRWKQDIGFAAIRTRKSMNRKEFVFSRTTAPASYGAGEVVHRSIDFSDGQ
jgi:hypothetical protein